MRNHNGHSLIPVQVACGDCGAPSDHVKGDRIYPHIQDLHAKSYYLCSACGAYVGTHPGTAEPLGTPAGKETRAARSSAHAHFDPLYKEVGRRHPSLGSARKRGYAWLAQKLGIAVSDCHIGNMDRRQALRVVEICKPEMDRMGIKPETRGRG